MSERVAPIVVKLGGRALAGASAFAELAADLAPLAGHVVLVHGGGPEVSAWSERLGLVPRFHQGRRVTDEATLEVATAVLAGLANKRLVVALAAHGIDAVGLAGLDGGIVLAVPHRDAATLGAVGAVAGVQPALLWALLSAGRTPVIASIGAHEGALLNLNADDVAAALARGLGAQALVLLSDAPGLVLGGKVTARLDPDAADRARAGDEVSAGMGPKLEAAAGAVRGGVSRAWIAAWSGPGTLGALLAGNGAGTCITAASIPQEAPHGH
ncbi:MAG: acetylglutamate kinase [Candidatus Eisenbacteria bacterium]